MLLPQLDKLAGVIAEIAGQKESLDGDPEAAIELADAENLRVGHRESENLEKRYCPLPGCTELVVPDPQANDKIFCCALHRKRLRLIRIRLRKWKERTDCIYVKLLCEFLEKPYFSSG